MQISSTLRTPLKPAAPRAATTPQNSLPQNEDKVQFSVVGPTVAKSALAAAAYGAMVGGASAYLYGSTDIGSATAIHMTAILGGGALGAGVLSHAIDHQFEKPSNYAMGALLGAGITWGTSALGMLGRPVVGAVAGAMAGAFYGAMGGVFFGSKPE